jgi:hypothetical protein
MKISSLITIPALVVALGSASHAATTAVQGLVPTSVNNTTTDVSIGYIFTVGASDISVTSLGYYDFAEDGIEVQAEVAIFDLLGNTLASAFIPPSTPVETFVDNNYRFISLASAVLLSSNTSYLLAAQSGDVLDNGAFSNVLPIAGTPILGSGIVFVGNTLTASTPAPFVTPPNSPLGFDIYLGNMQYDVVPEPSSAALMLSFGVMALLRRSRSR